ncbi:MAG TPA: DUF3311 domain-containing protein [Frankiaceae bacterium]|jgi:hypothetical protein|nr:uncharacterized protein [Mycobacterium sp.]
MDAPVPAPPAAAEVAPPPRQPLPYAVAGVLLALPFVALLWVSSYARVQPRWLGFPFFYWYQLVWVFVASALTWTAYVIVRRAERRRRTGSAPAARR